MIRITAKNQYASVENVFNDSEYERAFTYYNMLEEDGTWDEVNWIALPNMTLEEFTEKTLNSVIDQMQAIKITEEE